MLRKAQSALSNRQIIFVKAIRLFSNNDDGMCEYELVNSADNDRILFEPLEYECAGWILFTREEDGSFGKGSDRAAAFRRGSHRVSAWRKVLGIASRTTTY